MSAIIRTLKPKLIVNHNHRYVDVGPSKNPDKKTSYNLHFFKGTSRLAWFTTEDGSLIKLAKIIQAWVRDELLPASAEKVTLVVK